MIDHRHSEISWRERLGRGTYKQCTEAVEVMVEVVRMTFIVLVHQEIILLKRLMHEIRSGRWITKTFVLDINLSVDFNGKRIRLFGCNFRMMILRAVGVSNCWRRYLI